MHGCVWSLVSSYVAVLVGNIDTHMLQCWWAIVILICCSVGVLPKLQGNMNSCMYAYITASFPSHRRGRGSPTCSLRQHSEEEAAV